jgi:hypothetical protein
MMDETANHYRPDYSNVDQFETAERELSEADLSSVKLYLFRQGKSDYREREYIKNKKRWAPEIDDLTPISKEKVKQQAQIIASELDPTKHIIVFLSSPRARALSTAREIEQVLKNYGFEILLHSNTVEMLRSGGDFSPKVGSDNEILNFSEQNWTQTQSNRNPNLHTSGLRFKQFLSYFFAIDKKQLMANIHNPDSGFYNKIPVFIGITHGEVVHAGSGTDDEYRASFLGTLFQHSQKRAKLHSGDMLKFEFDLNHPGRVTVEIPAKTSPGQAQEHIAFTFNANNGSITVL